MSKLVHMFDKIQNFSYSDNNHYATTRFVFPTYYKTVQERHFVIVFVAFSNNVPSFATAHNGRNFLIVSNNYEAFWTNKSNTLRTLL